MAELRGRYLNSQGDEKVDLQAKFQAVQNALLNIVLSWAGKDSELSQLATWKPFSDESCDWFEPFWMFGIKEGFDIVLGNPPYVRQEQIGEQKAVLLENFKDAATGKSDLYVYFYARGLQLLKSNGIECFICSNSWLDVGYGVKLQEFLLKNSTVKAIVHNETERQFETAAINTIISFIQKSKPSADTETRFITFKDSLEKALADKTLQREIVRTREQLWCDGSDETGKKYEGDKWGGKYLRAPDIFYTILEKGKGKLVRLGDVAEVRRGFTTGANEFFFLDETQIQQWGIESEFLQPVIKSPRECKKIVIDPANLKFRLLMCHEEKKALAGTAILEYINWGESQGFHVRPSCRGRQRWWDLGERRVPLIISPSSFSDLYRAFINNCGVVSDKRLYEIYPQNESLLDNFAVSLNSTMTSLLLELNSRTGLGEGLVDLTVYEVASCLILNPSLIIKPTLFDRPIMILQQEIRQSDRRILDNIVFDILGLTTGERDAVYEAVVQLVEKRLKKARSV